MMIHLAPTTAHWSLLVQDYYFSISVITPRTSQELVSIDSADASNAALVRTQYGALILMGKSFYQVRGGKLARWVSPPSNTWWRSDPRVQRALVLAQLDVPLSPENNFDSFSFNRDLGVCMFEDEHRRVIAFSKRGVLFDKSYPREFVVRVRETSEGFLLSMTRYVGITDHVISTTVYVFDSSGHLIDQLQQQGVAYTGIDYMRDGRCLLLIDETSPKRFGDLVEIVLPSKKRRLLREKVSAAFSIR